MGRARNGERREDRDRQRVQQRALLAVGLPGAHTISAKRARRSARAIGIPAKSLRWSR